MQRFGTLPNLATSRICFPPSSLRVAKNSPQTMSSAPEGTEWIKPLEHYGPVTALATHNKIVFCGCGPILRIFDISTDRHKVLFQRKVLSRNKIHALKVSADGKRIFVGGGRNFSIINLENDIEDHKWKERAVDDWIVAGEFTSSNTVLVLTAHNTVYEIHVDTHRLVNLADCGVKSILYSGSIQTTPSGKVIIGSGTVMEGVVLWDYSTKKVLHCLTDHEGSIFGIKVDPTGSYAVSCSDDRSIKLYDVRSGTLLATGWGHGSRIWGLEFFTFEGSVHVFSHGEDTTARIWKYTPGDSELKQMHMWDNCHSGKHIWSGCVSMETNFCVTGGADGRVRLLAMSPYTSPSFLSFSLDTISQQTGVTFVKNEIIKQFYELEHGLVCITSHGTLLLFSYSSNNWQQITLPAEQKAKFTNFSIMAGFRRERVVAIAARNGDILLADFSLLEGNPTLTWIEDQYLHQNKVTNLLGYSTKDCIFLMVDSPNPLIPFILREFTYGNGAIQLRNTTCLAQPHQTSFTTTCMAIDVENNWLILASRYVTVAVYDLNLVADTIPLSAIFKKMTSGDTITSLSIISTQKNVLDLFLTVRDGAYAICTLKKDAAFSYHINLENKLSKGFIEGSFYDTNDLIVYGFKSSCFFIWNETKQLELMSVDCGGAHRQWELYRTDGLYRFVYINKSSIHFVQQHRKLINDGVLVEGTHGREIRDIAVYAAEGHTDVITASEDTTLRFGRLQNDGSVRTFWTLNKHVSGLQKVKFLSRELVGSCAANEEFIIWKLSGTNEPLIADCAVLPTQSKNPDLRIMDFDHIEVDGEQFIATIYSDSLIKVWRFDNCSFLLVCHGTYTTCCLLHVNFIQVEKRVFINVAATDGHIAIWELSFRSPAKELAAPIVRQQLHQNSIKGLALEKIAEDKYRLYTGGDDNALILSEIRFGSEIVVSVICFQELAASSTITSVVLAGPGRVATVSVDQMVRMWKLTGTTLQCLSTVYTTVADTGCSEIVPLNGQFLLLVGGSGLSTFQIA